MHFFADSNGEGPRSKFEREHAQTDGEKMSQWRVSVCDASGATLQLCKVTRVIQNVHDQPESDRRRPAVVNLLR